MKSANWLVEMKKGVLTTYYINNVPYASYILGDDMCKIRAAVELRNLKEEIVSDITDIEVLPDYSKLTDEEFLSQLPELLHTLCYTSFLALSAGLANLEEILGDEGVIHELTHILSNVEGCHKKSLSCVRDLFNSVQLKAVGLYEPV